MFKFIKQYAEKLDDISIYPIISLLVFVVFFIALLWYVKKMDKTVVKEISDLPLNAGEVNSINN